MKDLKKCYHNCSKCGKRYETTGDWPGESRCFFCFILEEELSPPKKKSGEIETNVPIHGVKKGRMKKKLFKHMIINGKKVLINKVGKSIRIVRNKPIVE